MKGKIIGLGVVVLAISLSAFVKRPQTRADQNGKYWFPLNASGYPNAVPSLIYMRNDPYGCSAAGWGNYCAGSWTSYSGSGPYYAAGTSVDLDYYRD